MEFDLARDAVFFRLGMVMGLGVYLVMRLAARHRLSLGADPGALARGSRHADASGDGKRFLSRLFKNAAPPPKPAQLPPVEAPAPPVVQPSLEPQLALDEPTEATEVVKAPPPVSPPIVRGRPRERKPQADPLAAVPRVPMVISNLDEQRWEVLFDGQPLARIDGQRELTCSLPRKAGVIELIELGGEAYCKAHIDPLASASLLLRVAEGRLLSFTSPDGRLPMKDQSGRRGPEQSTDRIQEEEAEPKLVVHSHDGEWADVWVDGRLQSKLRHERTVTIPLEMGQHLVEIWEFLADQAYTQATIWVAPGQVIEIRIEQGCPLVHLGGGRLSLDVVR